VERHDMLFELKALKLHGMAAAFDEVIDEGSKRSRNPFALPGRSLAAEDSERNARSIRGQMAGAKFPEYRELAVFDFAESPVHEQQIRTLHENGSANGTRNVVLVDGPGTGKTHLGRRWPLKRSRSIGACASSTSPPRSRRRGSLQHLLWIR